MHPSRQLPENATTPGSKGRHRLLWETGRVLIGAVALFVVLQTFVIEAYKIPSGSMEHTLLPGDFLLVNKLEFGSSLPFTARRLPPLSRPALGDVVVFVFPVDPERRYVKRIVGVPGDTLAMTGGWLLRNGQFVHEQYVTHQDPFTDPAEDAFNWQQGFLVKQEGNYRPTRDNWGPLVVPAGQYFVLGDNRDFSLDSRYWGFVPESLMLGIPLFVYYSFEPDSLTAAPWLRNVRWRRLGHSIP